MGGYIGARAGTLTTTVANVQDVTATDTTPEVTIINNTHEDTDGGREGKVIFKGQQSGGEESTLAEIQASHDGTADDEKGELILRVNDGNDGSSPSEVMRINSLGNVGIGTADIDVSTQAGGSGYKALQIESDEGGQLNFDHNDAGTGSTLGQINFQRAGEVVSEMEGVTDGATDSGRLVFRTQPNGGALTERMRLDSSGNLLVGATSTFDSSDSSNGSDDKFGFVGGRLDVDRNGSAAAAFKRTSSNGTLIHLARGGTGVVGTIGVTSSGASFNTSSDHRLKENVTDITNGITRVKQLSPKRFNFIADADTTVDGFLAHEAQAVVPEAVTGTHNEVDEDGNAVHQGIDQSKLVPLLTAALKEAITKIEDLETRVAALEGA